MTPKELRNERLAERMIKNLKRRNMEAFYCPTAKEAVKKVSELIADGSSVTWGGSMTIRDMGIPQALKERGTLEVLDRDVVTDREEVVKIYERAFTADVYLSSANAISEDGVIVNIDGNGNRVAAITWGPKKVIFIIGLNKVAQMVSVTIVIHRRASAITFIFCVIRLTENMWWCSWAKIGAIDMEQIERIKQMEQRLERAAAAVMTLSAALDRYEEIQGDISALNEYYGSKEWKQDYADDEAGQLPPDLKRGVLSEDAIWNVLTDSHELNERLHMFT